MLYDDIDMNSISLHLYDVWEKLNDQARESLELTWYQMLFYITYNNVVWWYRYVWIVYLKFHDENENVNNQAWESLELRWYYMLLSHTTMLYDDIDIYV